MATKKTKETQETPKSESLGSSIVSAIVALLFVGIAGYFVYSYFGNTLDLSFDKFFRGEDTGTETKKDITDKPYKEKTAEDISDDIMANSTVRKINNDTIYTTGSNSRATESVFGQWVATDYVEGEISKGSYEVKTGDTLWELAEGAYGDPYMWTTILQQNSDDVGFLPSGQQALIFPGQVLNI